MCVFSLVFNGARQRICSLVIEFQSPEMFGMLMVVNIYFINTGVNGSLFRKVYLSSEGGTKHLNQAPKLERNILSCGKHLMLGHGEQVS